MKILGLGGSRETNNNLASNCIQSLARDTTWTYHINIVPHTPRLAIDMRDYTITSVLPDCQSTLRYLRQTNTPYTLKPYCHIPHLYTQLKHHIIDAEDVQHVRFPIRICVKTSRIQPSSLVPIHVFTTQGEALMSPYIWLEAKVPDPQYRFIFNVSHPDVLSRLSRTPYFGVTSSVNTLTSYQCISNAYIAGDVMFCFTHSYTHICYIIISCTGIETMS